MINDTNDDDFERFLAEDNNAGSHWFIFGDSGD